MPQTNNRRLFQILLTAVFSLLFISSTSAKDMPGASETSYGVSNGGAFNFSLPIVIPEGTNGIQPNLSLTYSSGGGNGLLGQGWNLSGLGAITRCGSTIATHGKKGGVLHNANDRFCLNGKMLILTSGSYGAANSEYRTEVDEFSKVVASTTTVANINGGRAPTWFRVYRKDGMIYEYGIFSHSRQLINGSIHQWKLARVKDRNNNQYHIAYHTDDYRPSFITYTLNGSILAADKKIQFEYGTRPDVRTAYIQGKKFTYSKRLTAVTVTQGATTVRKYNLSYQQASVSKKSRITAIQECGINGNVCMPAIDVDWRGDGVGFVDTNAAANIAPHVMYQNNLIKDYFAQHQPIYGNSSNRCTNVDGCWVTSLKEVNFGAWADVNGDGEADQIIAVTLPNGTTKSLAYIKNGNSWTEQSKWRLPRPLRTYKDSLVNHSNGRFLNSVINQGQLTDVNGDGLVDVVYAYFHYSDAAQNNSATRVAVKETYLNTGDGWSTTPNTAYAPKDFIFDYVVNGAAPSRMETIRSRLIDVNGDGLVDWVRAFFDYTSGGNGVEYKTTWLNTGNGWANNAAYALPDVFAEYNNSHSPLSHGDFVDVNGDGLVDWVQAYRRTSDASVRKTWVNTGAGWQLDTKYNLPEDIYENMVGWDDRPLTKRGSFVDVNGDGLVDWVRSYQNYSNSKTRQ